ncbi:hypothetical protein F3J38_01970 [Pantoea sp. Acro-805]|uniref:Uncharacterized protein n=1 Tax=Candidatus Pantoea formicae TaxID=2608355 RepID=A0ABX0QTA4_9GAMM|nr:hypothetical protein [Pantoea formicae]MDF7647510.1 hypothetical protein [Erwiniaceae bacterium L1_54_3]NIE98844.1 hypothetical protein [Pantoea formicae]
MVEVKGLERFAEHFKNWQEHYVLIGGVASSLSMDEVGLGFRATKDLDIVLVVEVLSAEFVSHFWDFIKEGNYEIREKGDRKPNCYRFSKPANTDYPFQLELFSRMPEGLTLDDDATLTPIPVEENVSSLSAILLDEDYYKFLMEGRNYAEESGLTFINADRLIPFKAKAWLDLSHRKSLNEKVDSKDVNKHRNDVLRLVGLLSDTPVVLPLSIFKDMTQFIESLTGENVDLKALNIRGSLEEIIHRLKNGFVLPAT